MTDEKFEEFLRKAAQSYNAPPARAPRDETWSAIQATRSAGPRVVYGGASNLRSAGEKRFGSKVWWAAAAAGLVLVASGVGIGRWTAAPEAPPGSAAAATQADRDEAVASDPAPVDAPSIEAIRLAMENSSPAAVRSAVGKSSTADGRVAAIGRVASSGTATAARSAVVAATAPASAYQLATVNHLSQAEAMLTSFRTRSAADQQVDAQLAAWARELLSSTRLLLDSPVGADPQRLPLLQDLELLLVQIVQLSPSSTPQDRDIINRTLREDEVLTRLRTAIPAGQRGS